MGEIKEGIWMGGKGWMQATVTRDRRIIYCTKRPYAFTVASMSGGTEPLLCRGCDQAAHRR